jgi:translation initiation factor IF-3
MLGEMPTAQALQRAADAGLDLVEVNETSRPPICRIMDHGKATYDRRKKQSGGTTHRTQLKQIRLRAKTGDHDVDFKVKQAHDFLARRHKVKINVIFRGRENAHRERGQEMLESIAKQLADVSTVEQPPKMESGRTMSVLLTPKGKTN